MNKSLRFTDENFRREVVNSELLVLVDFWGSWCPPCKMVEPVIDELANELDGRVKVGRLNIDQNPAVRSMFEITAVPTFILFKYGQIIERVVGARSKKQLLQMVKLSLAIQKPKRPLKTIAIAETTKRHAADVHGEVQR